jgi:hypothetical protein
MKTHGIEVDSWIIISLANSMRTDLRIDQDLRVLLEMHARDLSVAERICRQGLGASRSHDACRD